MCASVFVILSTERLSFDQVTPVIYLGSRISSVDDYHRLRSYGVKACVDMREEGADPWSFDAFLWLPTPDHEPPTVAHLRMGIAFLKQCELNQMPAFVHCMMGVGRSSTMVLAYLLAGEFKGQSASTALDFIAAKRPAINPNPRQVRAAEEAAQGFRE